MSDLKDDIKEEVEIVKEEVETVAHNTLHPEDETDREARKRQPWMPIVGTVGAAIILLVIYMFFFK